MNDLRLLAMESGSEDEIRDRVQTWNKLLQEHSTNFGLSSREATILLFSAHRVLTDVLDDPLEYDFHEDDPTDEGGSIWADDLHLTSEVHDIVAKQLLKSLLHGDSDE